MSRSVLIVLLLAVAAASTALIVYSRNTETPVLTEEQRPYREKFLDTDKELPPIKEGQEMRPKW